MKCRHVQKTLIATSGRRKLSPEVHAHIAECPRCRRWQTRLNELDYAVTILPVPNSSQAKAAFQQKLLADPATPSRRWHERIPGKPWQKIAVAAAASVVIVLLWSGVLKREHAPERIAAPQADPLLASVLQRHSELATAQTSAQRIRTLTALSEDLDSETRSLARVAGSEDLAALAGLYEDVVKKGIVVQSDEIPADDRPTLLIEIADRLFRTSQTAELMIQDVPPSAADPLRQIARTARDANNLLRAKARTEVAIQDPNPVRHLPAGG